MDDMDESTVQTTRVDDTDESTVQSTQETPSGALRMGLSHFLVALVIFIKW